MTRPSLNPEVRPTVLICMPGSTTGVPAKRLGVLLPPHVDSVHISDDPGDTPAPSVLLVVHGWGTLESFAALRERQLKFATPVVVVVNQRGGSTILELLRAGATDCVRWPASSADAELLARVQMRLTRALQNFKLDAASLTLTCCDVSARPTLREFRIVHRLLQNAARWSTREEMTIAALRSGHASASPLRTRIYAIRRKLRNQSWRLAGNRMVGYRFDAAPAGAHADQTIDLRRHGGFRRHRGRIGLVTRPPSQGEPRQLRPAREPGICPKVEDERQ